MVCRPCFSYPPSHRTPINFSLRVYCGLGIGASSMICPVYIAELAPEKFAVAWGRFFNWESCVGIFVTLFLNKTVQGCGDEAWNTSVGWRWMLGIGAVPAVLFILLLLGGPESPRWLAQNNREEEARQILSRAAGAVDAEKQMTEIREAIGQEEGRFSEFFEASISVHLVLAVVLMLCSQFCGINAILYYSTDIFETAGADNAAAFAATAWIGVINLIATFVAIACVDKLGRRPLLMFGAVVQTFALGMIGWMFWARASDTAIPAGLVRLFQFIGSMVDPHRRPFSVVSSLSPRPLPCIGPIGWLFCSEVFPNRVRGRAMSVAAMCVWISCYIVSLDLSHVDDKPRNRAGQDLLDLRRREPVLLRFRRCSSFRKQRADAGTDRTVLERVAACTMTRDAHARVAPAALDHDEVANFAATGILTALASPNWPRPPRDVLFNCPDPAVIQPRRTARSTSSRRAAACRSSAATTCSTGNRWAASSIATPRPGPNGRCPAPAAFGPRTSAGSTAAIICITPSRLSAASASVIGLAVNKTARSRRCRLSLGGRGMVLESCRASATSTPSIRPCSWIADGQPYLFWGSYWSGIKAAKLDPATGKLPAGKRVFRRLPPRAPGVEPPAIEAAYVLCHDGYYYLFVSWDACCDQEQVPTRSSWAGRNRYWDPTSIPAAKLLTKAVVRSSWPATASGRPGRERPLCTSHGDWLVLAGFDAANLRRGRVLQIRRMYWPEGGWPVAGEALAAAVKFDRGNDKPGSPVRTWKLWADLGSQQSITLEADGRISGDGRGSWRQAGCMLTIDAKGQGLRKLFLDTEGRSFVGRNAEGQVIFGQRVP